MEFTITPTPQPTPTSCFRACVATIFGVPVDDVPKCCDGDSWDWTAFQRWLARHLGMQAVELWLNPDRPILYPVPFRIPVIVTGPSPRPCLSGRHAVVGVTKGLDGFEMLHDPHESGEFLGGDPTHVVFFALIDPKAR